MHLICDIEIDPTRVYTSDVFRQCHAGILARELLAILRCAERALVLPKCRATRFTGTRGIIQPGATGEFFALLIFGHNVTATRADGDFLSKKCGTGSPCLPAVVNLAPRVRYGVCAIELPPPSLPRVWHVRGR